MIIRIDDNNSIILNTTDFDLFEINKIDNNNIIVNETINSRDLFKEFNLNDNSINSISTILPEDLDIVPFFNKLFPKSIPNIELVMLADWPKV